MVTELDTGLDTSPLVPRGGAFPEVQLPRQRRSISTHDRHYLVATELNDAELTPLAATMP
jgi:hypothetical protein